MTTTRALVVGGDGVELGLQRFEHAVLSALNACGRLSVRRTTPRASTPRRTKGALSPAAVSVIVFSSRSIAAAERARSRSWNFWILPVEVLGIASKRISRGTL